MDGSGIPLNVLFLPWNKSPYHKSQAFANLNIMVKSVITDNVTGKTGISAKPVVKFFSGVSIMLPSDNGGVYGISSTSGIWQAALPSRIRQVIPLF